MIKIRRILFFWNKSQVKNIALRRLTWGSIKKKNEDFENMILIVKKMKKRMMIMMIVSIFMNNMTTPWKVMKISTPKKCSSLIITIIPYGHNCRLKSNLIKQVMNYHSLFIWTRCIKLHLKTCKLWEYISKWNTLIKSYLKLIHNM